ncbi:MAG: tRNA processing enzyme Rbn [Idiomarinaceae bacterium HL-53]|nr:MAG: tRNA processing enzyme Rbn [Idiomarinaceae bacterium HL-53]CUS47958.1 tRNA-processing RNAse BN [Idiomarinaceae bacterium HL-53]
MDATTIGAKITSKLKQVWAVSQDFVQFFSQRFAQEKINVTAGHLTYVSLLSLVPLLAVIFSMFAAFPMFESLRQSIQEAILANLVPTSGQAIEGYLNRFVENANQMTAVGALFLFVVALLMISAIDKALNTIWRVQQRRRMIISLAVYWMVITLGPVLVGVSIAVSGYLFSLTALADDYVSGVRSGLLGIVPILSMFVAFLLLYVTVPNKVVRVRHAWWGAALAAVLFELAKSGFEAYITYFPSYQLLYGAVAAIPILIVWIYLSWSIILLGAVLSATIEDYVDPERYDRVPEEEVEAVE